MNLRLLSLFCMCALLLSACYQQSEEAFSPVDSAAVASEVPAADIPSEPAGAEPPASTTLVVVEEAPLRLITPELAPGQAEQPTLTSLPTLLIDATAARETATPFVRPSPTPDFASLLDPSHECVYTVQSGDNLFRLSLAWNTTVDAIMTTNLLESDALAVFQLLLRPDCEYEIAPATSDDTPATSGDAPPDSTAAPAPPDSAPAANPEPTAEATSELLTIDDSAPAPTTAPPRIHVVSAGDTIESISLRYRVDVNELIALNGLSNRNALRVGQELQLPE